MSVVRNPKGNAKSLPIGRPKGAKNKTPEQLRQMVIEAVDNLGGAAYLQRQAEEQPAAFLQLFGKLLPKNVDSTLTLKGSSEPIRFEIIDANAKTDAPTS